MVENRGPEARAVRGAMSKREGSGVDEATERVACLEGFQYGILCTLTCNFHRSNPFSMSMSNGSPSAVD